MRLYDHEQQHHVQYQKFNLNKLTEGNLFQAIEFMVCSYNYRFLFSITEETSY